VELQNIYDLVINNNTIKNFLVDILPPSYIKKLEKSFDTQFSLEENDRDWFLNRKDKPSILFYIIESLRENNNDYIIFPKILSIDVLKSIPPMTYNEFKYAIEESSSDKEKAFLFLAISINYLIYHDIEKELNELKAILEEIYNPSIDQLIYEQYGISAKELLLYLNSNPKFFIEKLIDVFKFSFLFSHITYGIVNIIKYEVSNVKPLTFVNSLTNLSASSHTIVKILTETIKMPKVTPLLMAFFIIANQTAENYYLPLIKKSLMNKQDIYLVPNNSFIDIIREFIRVKKRFKSIVIDLSPELLFNTPPNTQYYILRIASKLTDNFQIINFNSFIISLIEKKKCPFKTIDNIYKLIEENQIIVKEKIINDPHFLYKIITKLFLQKKKEKVTKLLQEIDPFTKIMILLISSTKNNQTGKQIKKYILMDRENLSINSLLHSSTMFFTDKKIKDFMDLLPSIISSSPEQPIFSLVINVIAYLQDYNIFYKHPNFIIAKQLLFKYNPQKTVEYQLLNSNSRIEYINNYLKQKRKTEPILMLSIKQWRKIFEETPNLFRKHLFKSFIKSILILYSPEIIVKNKYEILKIASLIGEIEKDIVSEYLEFIEINIKSMQIFVPYEKLIKKKKEIFNDLGEYVNFPSLVLTITRYPFYTTIIKEENKNPFIKIPPHICKDHKIFYFYQLNHIPEDVSFFDIIKKSFPSPKVCVITIHDLSTASKFFNLLSHKFSNIFSKVIIDLPYDSNQLPTLSSQVASLIVTLTEQHLDYEIVINNVPFKQQIEKEVEKLKIRKRKEKQKINQIILGIDELIELHLSEFKTNEDKRNLEKVENLLNAIIQYIFSSPQTERPSNKTIEKITDFLTTIDEEILLISFFNLLQKKDYLYQIARGVNSFCNLPIARKILPKFLYNIYEFIVALGSSTMREESFSCINNNQIFDIVYFINIFDPIIAISEETGDNIEI